MHFRVRWTRTTSSAATGSSKGKIINGVTGKLVTPLLVEMKMPTYKTPEEMAAARLRGIQDMATGNSVTDPEQYYIAAYIPLTTRRLLGEK